MVLCVLVKNAPGRCHSKAVPSNLLLSSSWLGYAPFTGSTRVRIPLGVQINWPVRLSVRTLGFQPRKRGSTPLRATIEWMLQHSQEKPMNRLQFGKLVFGRSSSGPGRGAFGPQTWVRVPYALQNKVLSFIG